MFPSLQFYDGKLTDAPYLSTRKPSQEIQSFLKWQDPIHFYDISFSTQKGKQSYRNEEEAK